MSNINKDSTSGLHDASITTTDDAFDSANQTEILLPWPPCPDDGIQTQTRSASEQQQISTESVPIQSLEQGHDGDARNVQLQGERIIRFTDGPANNSAVTQTTFAEEVASEGRDMLQAHNYLLTEKKSTEKLDKMLKQPRLKGSDQANENADQDKQKDFAEETEHEVRQVTDGASQKSDNATKRIAVAATTSGHDPAQQLLPFPGAIAIGVESMNTQRDNIWRNHVDLLPTPTSPTVMHPTPYSQHEGHTALVATVVDNSLLPSATIISTEGPDTANRQRRRILLFLSCLFPSVLALVVSLAVTLTQSGNNNIIFVESSIKPSGTSILSAVPTSTPFTTQPTLHLSATPSFISIVPTFEITQSPYFSFFNNFMASPTDLIVDDNSFAGMLPTEIGLLTSLKYMKCSDNGFTGTIPSELGLLTDLTYLNQAYNKFDGTLPSEIGFLINLNYINLNNNVITGTIHTEIGLLTKLTFMEFSSNQFRGTIPTELGFLTQLLQFYMHYNTLTGTIPTEIGRLMQLDVLDMNFNNISSTIPTEVGLLTKLTFLTITDNALFGTLPTEFGMLNNLNKWSMNMNKLSGTLPTEIGLLTRLSVLTITYNSMVGTIPTDIGSIINLNEFNVNSNQLSGTLPTEIGLLTSLTFFEVSSNKLQGILPSEIGHLRTLSQLYLKYNNFTSTLPTEIGLLTSLSHLEMNSNSFVGTLPTEIGLLIHLTYLDLSRNGFTGTFPTEIAQLSFLTQLNIYENNFTG